MGTKVKEPRNQGGSGMDGALPSAADTAAGSPASPSRGRRGDYNTLLGVGNSGGKGSEEEGFTDGFSKLPLEQPDLQWWSRHEILAD